MREKLLEEAKAASDQAQDRQLYGAYCKKCDITATNPHADMMKWYYCKKCHDKTEYLGAIE